MWAAANGFRLHRPAAALAGGSSQYRQFVVAASLGSPADSTTPTPEAAAAAVAAKKTGRAVYWFVGVAAAAVLGIFAYPMVVTLPPPQSKSTPLPPVVPLPDAVDLPTVVAPAASPREQLKQRVETLKTELAELRKQKRSTHVDVKKRAIKDEIAIIESGLKRLDSA